MGYSNGDVSQATCLTRRGLEPQKEPAEPHGRGNELCRTWDWSKNRKPAITADRRPQGRRTAAQLRSKSLRKASRIVAPGFIHLRSWDNAKEIELLLGQRRVDFFIVGVQKGGTTALDGLLRQNHRIRMPREKEPHFFDDETVDWTNVDFTSYHSRFEAVNEETSAVGEATPILSYWPNALERIAKYNPHARIIMCLRHPSFRAHSHWRMEKARGADETPFSDAIRHSGRVRVREAPHGVHRVFSYVERGFYSAQIERAQSLFPPENLFFLRTDNLWAQPAAALRDICSFLGVPTDGAPTQSVYHVPIDTRQLGPMQLRDRRYLDTLYAADIRRASRLTALDLQDWLDPTYQESMGMATDGEI